MKKHTETLHIYSSVSLHSSCMHYASKFASTAVDEVVSGKT